MSFHGMRLRNGRVIGLAPPGPAAPPLPIPPGAAPPGIPAPNTLQGLPRALRMAIFQALFQGQPRVDVEGHLRPVALESLCSVGSRMIADEATEAYLRVTPFQVRIVSSFPDFSFYNRLINWGQAQAPPSLPPFWGQFMYTIAEFRERVRNARVLIPSQRSYSYGAQARFRIARTSGEFPWTTCPQWLKDAGPFIRDIQFDIIYPMVGFRPLVPPSRIRMLLWDYLISGTFSVQVVSPGDVLNPQTVMPPQQQLILSPFVAGGGWVYTLDPPELASYQGQCQRAWIEATRVRQSYLPAAPPPGVPGFTGYTLRDLRTIAKAFSEPSIYVIQD